MHISGLPLPLSCAIITSYIAITINKETTFERYNIVRIQIGLPPLPYDSTISSAVDYIGVSSSMLRVDEMANKNDDKKMIFNPETEVNDETHKGETKTK